ncbi:MAG TPA: sigma 54-interacting transcriptional regulator [Terracidiphilus sp.]
MSSTSHLVDNAWADRAYASTKCVTTQGSESDVRSGDLGVRLAHEQVGLEDDLLSNGNYSEIIGNNPNINCALSQVEAVAQTDSTVLIVGETGTGKELIARAVHEQSLRTGRPFIKLNCAALPTELIESELLGHERGAFTGALNQKIGRFEAADKGTLFLDEIGDLPLEVQPKLLRLLQEREFERLGSNHTRSVDVRLVAATNQNLEQLVAEHRFRDDLFYRLNIFPITLPPLRARASDIPLLVQHFVRKFGNQMGKQIDIIPEWGINELKTYHWPGNIRELQNVIERAVILTSGDTLNVPRFLRQQQTRTAKPPSHQTLRDLQRDHIIRALEETKWKIGGPNGAAVRLGLARTSLIYRMRKFGIPLRPS